MPGPDSVLVDAVWEEDSRPITCTRCSRSCRACAGRSATAGSWPPRAATAWRPATPSASSGSPRRATRRWSRGITTGRPALREALALWRGPALADLAGYRFAAAAAAQLEDLRLAATADRVEADLALGRGDRLVGELEALREHPLHERLAGQLIAALYAAGRQADALAAYERVRARLAEELGAMPSPELQAAHLAVLRGEATASAARAAARSNLPLPR